MNLDYSMFLLDYVQRFFLKRFDIVNLLISIVAVFISAISLIVVNHTLETPNYIIIINIFGLLAILGIFIYILFYVPHKLKKNNALILEIEKIIILNHDHINERNDKKKTEILDQLHVVFSKPTKENIDELKRRLSNPES